jgi:hypothetical protein
MPEVKKTYGRKRISRLAELRDEALEASFLEGRRRQIGRIAFGQITASWSAENGGVATLRDRGMRIGEYYFPNFGSDRADSITRLAISEEIDDARAVLTRFQMYLEPRKGYIDVYRHGFDWKHEDLADFRKYVGKRDKDERKLGITIPTKEDLALLQNELERGASGVYALKDLEG